MRETKGVALITGASGEIGSAIACTLAKSGYDLILHYHRNENKIKEVKQVCYSYNIKAFTMQGDLSNIYDITRMYEALKALNLYPSVLINALGQSHYGLIQDVTFEDWQRIVHTNIMSAYFCVQQAIPSMIKNKYGRIINLSSVWGNVGAANEVLYSMTKGAINTLTKALAKELAPSGITVNAIAPGVVMSKMMSNFSNEEIDDLKEMMPMKRFATSEEIAESVLYLLSEHAGYITGQIITIDGGWTFY